MATTGHELTTGGDAALDCALLLNGVIQAAGESDAWVGGRRALAGPSASGARSMDTSWGKRPDTS